MPRYKSEYEHYFGADHLMDAISYYIRNRLIDGFETAFLTPKEQQKYLQKKNREACLGKGFTL